MSYLPRVLLAAGLTPLLGVALLTAQAPFEQDPQQSSPGAAASILHSTSLTTLDGKLVGGGPDYFVEFDEDSVRYTPALATAPELHPATFAVTGFGRGEALRRPSPASLRTDGRTAIYQHQEFRACYEMRAAGVKQSFQFERLPVGTGDLVVSMSIDTDLAFAVGHGAPGTLTFRTGAHGGIHIGKVLGIDANGATTPGSMTYAGGTIEMRLPASFVQNAALPLVLDPLIGTEVPINATFDDSDFDVAYDATNNVYFTTWRRRFAISSYGLRGQRISDSGALIGGFVSIANLLASSATRVANVSTEDAFLVVYAVGGNILGRPVLAATGVVGSQVTIANSSDTLVTPDVGGEAVLDNEAIVVFRNSTANTIEALQVNVDGDVSPPTATPFSLATAVAIASSSPAWTNSAPRISNSGGRSGRHCIVYNRQFTTSPNTAVLAAIVGRNLAVLDDQLAIASQTTGDNDLPTVDGDGDNWLIAWESEATPASGDNDIHARAIGFDTHAPVPNQGYYSSSIIQVVADAGDDERAAEVCWMGESVAIAFEDETNVSSDYDVAIQPVDLFSALPCKLRVPVDGFGGDQGPIRIASKASGGAFEVDQALVVWSERDLTANDNKGYTRRFVSLDGQNTSLAGACGTPGYNPVSCAISGYSGFAARLRNSRPLTTAFWVASPSRIDLPCGQCSLIPDPWSGFVVTRSTDSRGNASIPIAIPTGLIGATFFHQWIVIDGSTPLCSTLGADLSTGNATHHTKSRWTPGSAGSRPSCPAERRSRCSTSLANSSRAASSRMAYRDASHSIPTATGWRSARKRRPSSCST